MDKTIVSLRAPFIVDGLFSLGAFLAAVVLIKDTSKAKLEHDLSVLRGLARFSPTSAFTSISLQRLRGFRGRYRPQAWPNRPEEVERRKHDCADRR